MEEHSHGASLILQLHIQYLFKDQLEQTIQQAISIHILELHLDQDMMDSGGKDLVIIQYMYLLETPLKIVQWLRLLHLLVSIYMLSDQEKIEFLTLRLSFYRDRLSESIGSISTLENLGNEIKIQMNQEDINKYNLFINLLTNELQALTNQG